MAIAGPFEKGKLCCPHLWEVWERPGYRCTGAWGHFWLSCDRTLPLGGTDRETNRGILAGRLVTVARGLVETAEPPWIIRRAVH